MNYLKTNYHSNWRWIERNEISRDRYRRYICQGDGEISSENKKIKFHVEKLAWSMNHKFLFLSAGVTLNVVSFGMLNTVAMSDSGLALYLRALALSDNGALIFNYAIGVARSQSLYVNSLFMVSPNKHELEISLRLRNFSPVETFNGLENNQKI